MPDYPPLIDASTIERVLYVLLLLSGVLNDFWDLGSRAIHSDHSLHTYSPWLNVTGAGYVHDPRRR